MTLEGILDQCVRFGFDAKETASVEALYKLRRDEYVSDRVNSKTSAYDALIVWRDAKAYVQKDTHQFMASLIDDAQRGVR